MLVATRVFVCFASAREPVLVVGLQEAITKSLYEGYNPAQGFGPERTPVVPRGSRTGDCLCSPGLFESRRWASCAVHSTTGLRLSTTHGLFRRGLGGRRSRSRDSPPVDAALAMGLFEYLGDDVEAQRT